MALTGTHTTARLDQLLSLTDKVYYASTAGVVAGGTGGSDMTTQIQAALDAAAILGVPVMWPAGTIPYSGTITFAVSMMSAGRTKFYNTAAGGHNSRFWIDSIDNWFITGCEWESANSAGASITEADVAIRATSCNNYAIHGARFKNMNGAGILNRSGADYEITDTYMEGMWKDGIHNVKACDNFRISGVIATDCGDDVIAVVGYLSDAVYPTNGVIENVVINGTKSARGITFVGSAHMKLTNFVVDGAYLSGVYIAAESGTFASYGNTDISVSNGTIINCARSSTANGALHISNVTSYKNKDIKITDVDILASSYYGALIFGVASWLAEDVTLTRVTIRDTTDTANKNGAGVGAGAFDGINAAYTKNLTINGCKISDAGQYALICTATNAGKITIKDVTITDPNVNGNGAVVDAVNIAASSAADLIVIDGVHLDSTAHTIERFIENTNAGKTLWGYNTIAGGCLGTFSIGISSTSISVTASPFAWQNPNKYPVHVRVSAQDTTAIDRSPNGSTYVTTGKNASTTIGAYVIVEPEGYLRVTYAGTAPTMTWIPVRT